MAASSQKDNSTYRFKVELRRNALREIDQPCVLETHGGYGQIYEACYRSVADGVVFEQDSRKSSALARQRPEWAVYEADSTVALAAGIGQEWPVNVLDCDPYGQPWPVIRAFFESERPFQPRMLVVVNDGLRQKLKANGAWTMDLLSELVEQYGNERLYAQYLAVCQLLLEKITAQRGYRLCRWAGYYCGHAQQMTHYAALLER